MSPGQGEKAVDKGAVHRRGGNAKKEGRPRFFAKQTNHTKTHGFSEKYGMRREKNPKKSPEFRHSRTAENGGSRLLFYFIIAHSIHNIKWKLWITCIATAGWRREKRPRHTKRGGAGKCRHKMLKRYEKNEFFAKKLDISRPLYDNIYRIILCGQAAAYARVSRRTYAGAHP